MCENDSKKFNDKYLIKSKEELEEGLKKMSEYEQIYSIALFDILGFSNFVNNHGNQVILDFYNKLLDIIHRQESTYGRNSEFAGSVVPVPVSPDWKNNVYVAEANAFINVCHFSDTFLIYVNYNVGKKGKWLADGKHEPYPLLLGEPGTPYYPDIYNKHYIYLSFLQTCMEFFCQAIIAGIPLRGCISTGPAIMNRYKSVYIGAPLVEAARGETAQNALGIAFGKSFNNSHPVYNNYFIPYLDHIKDSEKSEYLSPMMLDWARYWRESPDYKDYNLVDCINKMNKDLKHSSYYDNAITFYDFSEKNKNWYHEIDRNDINEISDYYERTKEWYKSVK